MNLFIGDFSYKPNILGITIWQATISFAWHDALENNTVFIKGITQQVFHPLLSSKNASYVNSHSTSSLGWSMRSHVGGTQIYFIKDNIIFTTSIVDIQVSSRIHHTLWKSDNSNNT